MSSMIQSSHVGSIKLPFIDSIKVLPNQYKNQSPSDVKQLLITIAALVLVGCGESV